MHAVFMFFFLALLFTQGGGKAAALLITLGVWGAYAFATRTKAPVAQPAAVAQAQPAVPGMFAGVQARLAQSSWQSIGFGIAFTMALGRAIYLIFWGGWGLLHAGTWFAVVAALLWTAFFSWSSFVSGLKSAYDFIMGRHSLWAVALTTVVIVVVLIFIVRFVWSGIPTT